MELNIFVHELRKALVERGIPEETAAKHVSNLSRSFTSDDLSEIDAISSVDEVNQLADSISVILARSRKPNTAQSASASAPIQTPVPSSHERHEHTERPERLEPIKRSEPVQKQVKPKKQPVKSRYDDDNDFFEYSPEHPPSTKGMLVFWVGLFLTLPISIGIVAIIFGAFAAVFIGLAGLIVAGVALLAGVVAAGAGISLVGIIFGITQLFSFAAAGIYEIGLGVMVAGAALFVSVLIYNLSIRFFPWVITLVGNLMGFVFSKLKEAFFSIRRECYKL